MHESRAKKNTFIAYMSVGVMRDEKLKLRDLHVSHTLREHLKIETRLRGGRFESEG
jgi:hypothetical protein